MTSVQYLANYLFPEIGFHFCQILVKKDE
jgi:hypothetical protein